jgi:6-phosphogluconolactonase (cycloisomerase 2 family)
MTVLIDYTKGFFETTEGDTVGTVTGNATLDLSTGSVFSHTPTANTTFAFTNPAASGTSSSATLKLTGANVAVGYDLASASYDSVSLSISGQNQFPTGLFFKDDGTKVYMLGQNTVYQYALSTAWDLSTASYESKSFDSGTQTTFSEAVSFKSDGTIMYVTSRSTSTDAIYQYTLSTAWDVSTASYASKFLDVASQELNPRAAYFKPDGSKVYVAGTSNDTIYQYALSTAWDVSTGSFETGKSFSVSSQEGSPNSLYFSPNGDKVWIIGTVNQTVYQYSLSTAWDISTASYDSVSFSVSSQDTGPKELFFKSDGTKMYIVGDTNDAIYQYSTSSSALATITYPASVIWSGGTTPTAPANGETDVYSFYTDDGGTTYYGFVSGDALA